jgi:hypothetical protein
MKELDYDLSEHESKSLKEVEQFAPFDAVVTIGMWGCLSLDAGKKNY